jgi:hypothetical protein
MEEIGDLFWILKIKCHQCVNTTHEIVIFEWSVSKQSNSMSTPRAITYRVSSMVPMLCPMPSETIVKLLNETI